MTKVTVGFLNDGEGDILKSVQNAFSGGTGSVIFHEPTAYAMTGSYEESKLVDFGFAHNSPTDKRRVAQWPIGTVSSCSRSQRMTPSPR